LTLKGSDWREVTIDGTQSGTVVTIPGGVTATLESLTIRNGLVTTDFPNNGGGGINNNGVLNLIGTLVVDNSANTPDAGDFLPIVGGIVNSGVLNMKRSSIVSNSGSGGCTTAGGVLNFNGSVTIEDSLIAENTVSPGNECLGPGIVPVASGYFNVQGNSTVNTTTFWKNSISTVGTFALDRSTINSSDGNGILNAGTLTVVNSTITGSTDSGIVNFFGEISGTFEMSNSTVADNAGDGVDFGEPLGSTMRNSILAGNGGADCNGDFISGDYNLIENTTDCAWVGGGHDITGVSPELKKLGFYGGPTQTMDLKSGSPAINAGNPAGCADANGNLLTTDQRGFPRPSPAGGRCDIGAVEVQMRAGW